MAESTDNDAAPMHFSNVGRKRKDKLVRVAKARRKSCAQMFRDWIDGLKEVS